VLQITFNQTVTFGNTASFILSTAAGMTLTFFNSTTLPVQTAFDPSSLGCTVLSSIVQIPVAISGLNLLPPIYNCSSLRSIVLKLTVLNATSVQLTVPSPLLAPSQGIVVSMGFNSVCSAMQTGSCAPAAVLFSTVAYPNISAVLKLTSLELLRADLSASQPRATLTSLLSGVSSATIDTLVVSDDTTMVRLTCVDPIPENVVPLVGLLQATVSALSTLLPGAGASTWNGFKTTAFTDRLVLHANPPVLQLLSGCVRATLFQITCNAPPVHADSLRLVYMGWAVRAGSSLVLPALLVGMPFFDASGFPLTLSGTLSTLSPMGSRRFAVNPNTNSRTPKDLATFAPVGTTSTEFDVSGAGPALNGAGAWALPAVQQVLVLVTFRIPYIA
jgi:hypothetical protein